MMKQIFHSTKTGSDSPIGIALVNYGVVVHITQLRIIVLTNL